MLSKGSLNAPSLAAARTAPQIKNPNTFRGGVALKELRINHGSGRSVAIAIHGKRTNGVSRSLKMKKKAAVSQVSVTRVHDPPEMENPTRLPSTKPSDVNSKPTTCACASKKTTRENLSSFH